MTFEQFITYVVWLSILLFVFVFFKAIFTWLDRVEANTEAERAHAALEDAQAQQIRARTVRIEPCGGYVFVIDGELHDGLPYINAGGAALTTPAAIDLDADVRRVALELVQMSKAKYTASGKQLVTYEESGMDHNAHAAAVKWMAGRGLVLPTNSGVFARDANLTALERYLMLSALPPAA